MASLGFRPPQFSEDFAWLPAWLQIEASPQNASDQSSKGNTRNEKNVETFPGAYDNCHLFWSGEDAFLNNVTPSPSNLLHPCLHLSSDGGSCYSQSHLAFAFKTLHGSSQVLSVQEVETSTVPVERTHQPEKDNNEAAKFPHQTSSPVLVNNVAPPSPIDGNDNNSEFEEQFNVRHIEDADINDAIELSVAASEALVIHELMKIGADSVPTGAILEAALRVQQVRLKAFENDFFCPSDETDEIDFLSDLDDLVMTEAFLDVGLPFSEPDNEHGYGLEVSQVKETPVSDNQNVHESGTKNEHHYKTFDDSALGLNASNVACHDPMLHQQAEEISCVRALEQPQGHIISSHACALQNPVADRFRSRWVGGWTVKETDASAKLKRKNTVSTQFTSVVETSFLSESADIAPDENSFVQNHESNSEIASQSSLPFEALHDKADESIFISQEVRSCSLSSVDPLCSVVPCSISLEKAGSAFALSHKDREDGQICFSKESGLQVESWPKTSDVNIVSIHVDGQVVPINTGEDFGVLVERKISSLKSYSVLPKCDHIFQHHHHDQQCSTKYAEEPLGSDQVKFCQGSSVFENSKGFSPCNDIFEGTVGKDNERNQEITIVENPDAEKTSPKRTHNECAVEGAELLRTSIQRRSSWIVNQRAGCHLQDSRPFVNNLPGEDALEQSIAKNTMLKPGRRKYLQKPQSILKDSNSASNLFRKRVCFSEVEVELLRNRDLQKPQSLQQNCSTIRANKRSKYFSPWTDKTHDMRSCFMGQLKDVKRLIFHGVQFLLTGFSTQREREIVEIVERYGGVVLSDIPSPSNSRAKRTSRSNIQQIPVVISSKKLQTMKFLFGCAVNALILKVKWLIDSVAAGSALPPEKYLILSNRANLKYTRIGKLVCCDDYKPIFDKIGIILHGKHKFCAKLEIIIKHGGGIVFKTLQRLIQSLDSNKIFMGAIVAEDERALRHLRQCALERKIPVMPGSWITKSLHLGKLHPLKEKEDTPTKIKLPKLATSVDWIEEI